MLLRFLPWIALGLLCLPAADILGMVWLWQHIGGWLLLWLATSTFVGVVILKNWRIAAAWALLDGLRNGAVPLGRIFWFGRSLLAALLLIFPGPVSDVFAILLLLPWPGHNKTLGGWRSDQEPIIDAQFSRVPNAETPALPPQRDK